jgi:hypothetical protein
MQETPMYRRSISAVLSLALVVAMALPATADNKHGSSSLAAGRSTGFTVPLNGATDGQGAFTGSLRILRFAVQDGKLVASGIVTGTLVDENGVSTAVIRTVTLPVNTGGGTTTLAAPAVIACDILHLELGPLDLDLLGLVIHLDKVVLDIDAVPGAGNLLGNLLCAITNLLNGGGPLSQIAALLNQLLDLLT